MRGKQAWCRSEDPQPSEARRSGSRKPNLYAHVFGIVAGQRSCQQQHQRRDHDDDRRDEHQRLKGR